MRGAMDLVALDFECADQGVDAILWRDGLEQGLLFHGVKWQHRGERIHQTICGNGQQLLPVGLHPGRGEKAVQQLDQTVAVFEVIAARQLEIGAIGFPVRDYQPVAAGAVQLFANVESAQTGEDQLNTKSKSLLLVSVDSKRR